MREVMNVGENRVQNGVLDGLESKNEENFLSIELLDSSRYAKDRMRVLRESPLYSQLRRYSATSILSDNETPRYLPTGSILIEQEQNSPKGTRYGSHGYLEQNILRTYNYISYHIVELELYDLTSFVLTFQI
ncbi:hypothetical protein E3N88_43354 [Mikania micrantha]|uniref:Uncharacterized protein n=1 Tax=Mikania micrantha TaxID=192012 RepID=A0A5N6LF65_9ASTR|nr:hypothetical protein E3N88_43354 [Mikania micrantha]